VPVVLRVQPPQVVRQADARQAHAALPVLELAARLARERVAALLAQEQVAAQR